MGTFLIAFVERRPRDQKPSLSGKCRGSCASAQALVSEETAVSLSPWDVWGKLMEKQGVGKGRIYTSGFEHWPRFLPFPLERGEGGTFEQRAAGVTGFIWVPKSSHLFWPMVADKCFSCENRENKSGTQQCSFLKKKKKKELRQCVRLA